MMVVLVASRNPVRLSGVLTRWLLEASDGVYVGNVSAAIRRSVWERVLADIGRGSAPMEWPACTERGLDFASHNSEWQIVDSDGLALVRRPTTDELLRRRALELYSGMTAPEINKDMAAWLRKHHPDARTPRRRTIAARLTAVRVRHAVDYAVEGKSMQEGESDR